VPQFTLAMKLGRMAYMRRRGELRDRFWLLCKKRSLVLLAWGEELVNENWGKQITFREYRRFIIAAMRRT